MNSKKIKIIIPSHNCTNKLISVIQSLRKNNITSKIYIVDDNSLVRSKLIINFIKNKFSNIEVLINNKNLGQGGSIKKAFNNIFEFTENENKKRFNQKGFFPIDTIVNKSTISNNEHLYKSLEKEIFEKSKVKHLLKTANYIKEKGSEVIFFELPTNLLSKYFNKNYLSNYQKSLKHINANFKLITVDENLFSSQNYRNIDHMNSSGAKIATKEIIKLLE